MSTIKTGKIDNKNSNSSVLQEKKNFHMLEENFNQKIK